MKARLLVVLFVLALGVPAFGTSIDFGSAGVVGGTLTLGPPINGLNIPITTMNVIDSPVAADDGAYVVTGTCGPSLGGCLDFDTAGAGSISIVGTVAGVTGTLLSGNIMNYTLTPEAGHGYAFYADGLDTKDPELLTAIGLSPTQAFTYFGFTSFITTGGRLAADSPDITNTTTPEPVSMLLMGTFFSLAGGLLSKKKRAL